MANPIRCPKCGKLFASLAAVKPRSLGLALIATCPSCGARWAVNKDWRKAKNGNP